MTDLTEAMSGKDKIMFITKIVLNEKMAARIHRPLKVIAFNANGIWRRRFVLSKQLQDLHIDVALLSETHLKPRECFIPDYRFYRTDRFPGRAMVTYAICAIRTLDKGETVHKRQTHPLIRDDVT
jgi:hypothetical protein